MGVGRFVRDFIEQFVEQQSPAVVDFDLDGPEVTLWVRGDDDVAPITKEFRHVLQIMMDVYGNALVYVKVK